MRACRPGAIDPARWLAALKAGRSFATNGPLLGLTLGGAGVGDELTFPAAPARVSYSVRLQSIVPVDHLELVCNGRVMRSFAGAQARGSRRVQRQHHTRAQRLVRAARDSPWGRSIRCSTITCTRPPVPIYVTIGGRPPRSPEDARYFAAWIERVTQATDAYPDWNSAAEKRRVLETLAKARAVFVAQE